MTLAWLKDKAESVKLRNARGLMGEEYIMVGGEGRGTSRGGYIRDFVFLLSWLLRVVG